MIEDHIGEVECPDCGEQVTSEELVEHGWEHDEWPFSDLFPEYYICDCGPVPCYLKVERDIGPYYIAWDDRDYVDKVDPYELMRHDWEQVTPDETPFPNFE